MENIAALIKKVTEQGQTVLMPAILLGVIVIGGLLVMMNNTRDGRSWITNGLLGGAVVVGATTIVALVKG